MKRNFPMFLIINKERRDPESLRDLVAWVPSGCSCSSGKRPMVQITILPYINFSVLKQVEGGHLSAIAHVVGPLGRHQYFINRQQVR